MVKLPTLVTAVALRSGDTALMLHTTLGSVDPGAVVGNKSV